MRRNAWAIIISPDEGMNTHVGSGVETTESFIAEGAWAGAFSAGGLRTSTFRCGSGAIFDQDTVTLCAPTHSVDPIYCYSQDDLLIASNSLHLIVALDDSARPSSLAKVHKEARTLKAGRTDYGRVLYATSTGIMYRFAFGTVTIEKSSLRLTEEHPTSLSGFRNYSDYNEHLLATLLSLVDNARDPRRTAPYGEVVTTVSSGYDSTACAALGKAVGAQTAVTLTTGRGNTSDSGKPVADALGMECYEYARFGADLAVQKGPSKSAYYLDASHLVAEHSDFLATINTTEDLYFSSFTPHIENAIVLTGFHGDKVWDKECSSGAHIVRGDNSGTGLDEFRKRVGFVNVPIPYIGAEHYTDLARICQSDEMANYRVPRSYDRPLPRRMAEEAGVPRGAFGRRKAMGSVLLQNTETLRVQAFQELVDEYSAALVDSSRLVNSHR